MGIAASRPQSLHNFYLGIPHSPFCECSDHIHDPDGPNDWLNNLRCVGYGPRGGDAALPRLHKHYTSVYTSISHLKCRHTCKYRDGVVVWVDGWGKVMLKECGQRMPGFRCYTCISRMGEDVGQIKIPEVATMGGGGEGPRDWSALFTPGFD